MDRGAAPVARNFITGLAGALLLMGLPESIRGVLASEIPLVV